MSARLWLGKSTLGNLSRKLLRRSTVKASGLSIVWVRSLITNYTWNYKSLTRIGIFWIGCCSYYGRQVAINMYIYVYLLASAVPIDCSSSDLFDSHQNNKKKLRRSKVINKNVWPKVLLLRGHGPGAPKGLGLFSGSACWRSNRSLWPRWEKQDATTWINF